MNRKGIQRHPTAATHRSNAKAGSGSLVCLFIAKVCITVLLCVTAHAESDFIVNAGGGLRFFELRSVDGAEVIHKRALSQVLGVTFTHQRPRGAHFLVVTRLNLSTDLQGTLTGMGR